jgi:sugar phosphate isomerase/epimerase
MTIPLKLSCVPMIYFDALVVERSMALNDWFRIAAHDLKLEATEIQHRCLASYDPAYLASVRDMMDSYGLGVCQITGSGDFVHPDPSVRQQEVATLKQQIQGAQILGAGCIRITAGQQHQGLALHDAIRNFRGCMEQVFDLAGQAGVYLAYENHYKDYFWPLPDFSFRSADFLAFFDAMRDTPLRVNFDCANQIMAGEEVLPLLEHVKDRVVHVHANDRATAGQYKHSIVGEGITPLKKIFSTLIASGFRGYLSLEYNGENGIEGTRASLDAIRRVWIEAQQQDPVAV